MRESIQIPAILLTTVLGKSYLAHLEQWLAGWQRFEWICMRESMQILAILLTTVLGKSYLAHLEQWLAGWQRFERICMMESLTESMQITDILGLQHWKSGQ